MLYEVITHVLEKVQLPFDELEALRLCDHEGLSQTEAGNRMGISRGTVQRLVTSGRKKVIETIVNCKALVIARITSYNVCYTKLLRQNG